VLRVRSYAGVCPADSEPKFLYGFHDGRALYELESGLRLTNRRIRDNETRIQQIEIELAERANALIAVTTTREERVLLVVETTQLAEERSTRKNEIADLLAERQRLQAELATARQELLTKR
jgi:predicted  nucleic acid-binding Zn-ribbon protein